MKEKFSDLTLYKIDIRKVELADVEQLQLISRKTFFEAFAGGNTKENMQKYLEEGFSVDRLTTELKNPNSEFYFAIVDSKTIGYLKINFGQAQTELKEQTTIEIERIYVLKEFLGKKVGQILYKTAFDIAEKMNADFLWLGVWEENLRAINFYKKIGFVEFDKHVFKLGNEEQTDIMMKLKLD